MTLVADKTKAVLISNRKVVEKMEVTVGGTNIKSKKAIKYLSLIIDDRLNFKEHMKYNGEKAFVSQRALARKMPNIRGPNPFKRRIMSRVVTLTMLYHIGKKGGNCPRCIV